MTRTWITAIYNRTYRDIQNVQIDPDQENPKGCWNSVDLNRIEKNTAYCAEWILEQEIVHTAPSITVYENDYWTGDKIPTKADINRIINNVSLLVELCRINPAISSLLPTIYTATQVNYVLANQIEYALELMHNQPPLPDQYWQLKINHGIVKTIIRKDGTTEIVNATEALVAESEIVTIEGIGYGEYAQSQIFTYWSGQAEDLALLEHYDESPTSFTMPYRAVTFTANFQTSITKTLTITNGYISTSGDPSATSGPTTGTYLPGTQIMIIANVASSGQEFYEWTGTQAALNNLIGNTNEADPSTCILTMPDSDVTLAPHYIDAGKHIVTVNGGTGTGLYNYGDTVYISADIPSHYQFSNWSGNTSYLSDISQSFQYFTMGDENISFTAHCNYVYSYNNVQVVGGYITVNGENVTQATGLQEGTSYTLVPDSPDINQGLSSWTIDGYGSVSGNTFTVGDGDAIITANYGSYRTLTVNNLDNGGGAATYITAEGRNWEVSTEQRVMEVGRPSYYPKNVKFDGWYENGVKISSDNPLILTAGNSDRELTAVYVTYPMYLIREYYYARIN